MNKIVPPYTPEDIENLIESFKYDLNEANKKIDLLVQRLEKVEFLLTMERPKPKAPPFYDEPPF